MKTVLLVLALGVCYRAQATISFEQSTSGHTVGCGGLTCDANIASRGSSHLGILIVFPLSSKAEVTLTGLSDDAGSAWTVPGACVAGNNSYPGFCGYAISLNISVTTITATFSSVPHDMFWFFVEYSTTASPFVFDALSVTDAVTPACSACLGRALTLTSSHEVIVQSALSNVESTDAITGTYTNPAEFGIGVCGSINTADGSAPTWTQSGLTTDLEEIAIAFKESPGSTTPGQFPRIV